MKEKIQVLNLTPHDINIYNKNKEMIKIIKPLDPDNPARIHANRTLVGEVNGIPLFKTKYGDPINLPDPKPNVILIVSGMIRSAFPNRDDLWQPGELVRNSENQPIGAYGLTQ